jgi:glycosyltransferase involved in cell wall biosynthesis
MMSRAGYRVVFLANEGESIEAAETVQILSRAEHGDYFHALTDTQFHDSNSTLGSDGWRLFDARVRAELRARVKPGDIIIHTFGRAYAGLVRAFPEQVHVETPVGNNDRPFGAYRIFESEAWRHYCMGRFETMRDPYDGQLMFPAEPGLARNFSWAIPNARDAKDWPLGTGEGDYVLFLGRICDAKGCHRIAEIIRRWDKLHPGDGLRFVFAGQGDFDRVATQTMRGDISLARRLEYVGHIKGKDRAKLVGDARVMLCPTEYVEPGGGAAVEALMCGTPVLASAWGCFTEQIDHGYNGGLCRTVADYVKGIEFAKWLNKSRQGNRMMAVAKHSFEAVAPQFDRVFRSFAALLSDDETSVNVP